MQIESWAKIYQEEAINLQKICMRYLHDEETAQDIVQDTFIKAIENEESIKHGDKRKSWLRKVAVNETFQRLKKLNKIPIMNIEQVDELQSEEEEEMLTHERKIIEKANLSKQDILQTLNSIVISQKNRFHSVCYRRLFT
jgi:RNA polymerase sigma factor (sigma-70 family)